MFFHFLLFFSLFSYNFDSPRMDVTQNGRSNVKPVMTQNGCVEYSGFRVECKRGGYGTNSGN